MISRICEEFACTPAEALAQPAVLVMEILELRQYERAYRDVMAATTERPASAAARSLVAPVIEAIAAEHRAARGY